MFDEIGSFGYVEGVVVCYVFWCFVGIDFVDCQMCDWNVIGFGVDIEEVGGEFCWVGIGVECFVIGGDMVGKFGDVVVFCC